MLYIDVKFHCKLLTSAFLPPYKGSTLRGALGFNLRRALCVTRADDCRCCILVRNCIFPRIFSSSVSTVADNGAPCLPPPFCIEPPLDQKRVYEAGESLVFSLKLFSFAVEYLPYFVHAFNMAGERGLGSGQNAGRFCVEDIREEGESILDAGHNQLLPWNVKDILLPSFLPERDDKVMALRLLTPLRFKAANHLHASLDFPILLNLILRRLRSLWALDGLSARFGEQDFAAMSACAARTRTLESHLRWHDWSRYSNRQGAAMKLGGLMGETRYAGNLGGFRELLDFARMAHIGKQTSFGLGAMDFSFQL